jgi:ribosomal protein S18 acetylase RimI-like enzyme
MPVIVREARPEEHARLGELVVAAYRSLPEFDEPGYEPELCDVARRSREAVVLVAVDAAADQRPLGCVTYVPGPESPWAELLGPGEAAIRMLAVDPAARGEGAGTALASACVARARAEGRAAIFLHSLAYMRAAWGSRCASGMALAEPRCARSRAQARRVIGGRRRRAAAS